MTTLLLLNVGSSSIKYKAVSKGKVIVEGRHAALTSDKEYAVAFRQIEAMLKGKNINAEFIVHRIVHGFGLSDTCFFNSRVAEHIEKGIMAAPLHNKPQLEALRYFDRKKKQICVFDSLPFEFDEINSGYAIPKEIAEELGIRRVGFHGLSHKYMYEHFKSSLSLSRKKTVTVHLGSGSSVSAFIKGRAVYNSMGFTPLSGIIMSTRTGDIDPGIIFYLNDMGMSPDKVFDMFNYESGMKGLTGEKDFLTILHKRKAGNKYDTAYKMFIQSVRDNVAVASSRIGGVDNIIFSGEIGSGSETVRSDVKKGLSFLGSRVKYSFVKADEESILLSEAQKIIRKAGLKDKPSTPKKKKGRTASERKKARRKTPAKSKPARKTENKAKNKTVDKSKRKTNSNQKTNSKNASKSRQKNNKKTGSKRK